MPIKTDDATHMRVNTDLQTQVIKLFEEGLITQAAFNLCSKFTSLPVQHNTPIQFDKEDWLIYANTRASNWKRDYACLEEHGIWKKIKYNYVVNPIYVFSGKEGWQNTAMEYWEKDKVFNFKILKEIVMQNKQKQKDNIQAINQQEVDNTIPLL